MSFQKNWTETTKQHSYKMKEFYVSPAVQITVLALEGTLLYSAINDMEDNPVFLEDLTTDFIL